MKMDFTVPAQNLGLELDEYMELVELFLETGGDDLKKIEDALIKNDIPTVVERSHSLKGASGNLGITEIYEKAKDMENRSRDNNLDGIENAVEEIKKYFEDIVTALAR
jgi:HPt (histidine-containing phosphotransfer) domain-containing protein